MYITNQIPPINNSALITENKTTEKNYKILVFFTPINIYMGHFTIEIRLNFLIYMFTAETLVRYYIGQILYYINLYMNNRHSMLIFN